MVDDAVLYFGHVAVDGMYEDGPGGWDGLVSAPTTTEVGSYCIPHLAFVGRELRNIDSLC